MNGTMRTERPVMKPERAGVVVRMPATWKAGRPPRPQATATVGGKAPSGLGKDALLDFRMEVTLEGERLTLAEVKEILAGASGLALIRGRWVEVDRDRLDRMMARFREAERLAAEGGLTFGEAMRMLAGTDIGTDGSGAGTDPDWSAVVAGPWLAETLKGLRTPEGLAKVDPGRALRGTLRPYQQVGVRWLHLLSRLGLGACLADDMGLGKTIQMLALLLAERSDPGASRRPSLLVAPASLLANWAAEIERFAPTLTFVIAHPSAMPADEVKSLAPEKLSAVDLVMTSYGSLLRIPGLVRTAWHLVVLDEAQAIKNPAAKQTRAAKALQARARIALTGTPIENGLGDLWSIFDFINPGLLGSAREFIGYTKRLSDAPGSPYGPLRNLVRPYILRRLKSDKSVISDLPDKTEVKAFCQLSRVQAALYQQAVKELAEQLGEAEGIRRRGVVLAFLMRFKQICNHPSQWLGDGEWAEDDSGKWARLRELCEVIAAKQEKALVFTQFREITDPDGECATLLTVFLPTEAIGRKVAKELGTKVVADSGWHVYNNMEQILEKRTVTPEGCPYTCQFYKGGEVKYWKGMLPQTDALLARAINISIGVSDGGLGSGFGITIRDGADVIDARAEQFLKIAGQYL